MKKPGFTVILFLVFTLILGCSVLAVEDNSLQEIKEKGKFIVGLDDAFPPMGFRDENGDIVGFDIDLAKEVASRMGVEVEFKPVEWDGIVLSLQNGIIDVVWNGMTITPEREKMIDFSKPYMDNKQIIIVRASTDIEEPGDLAGKIVGLQLGSSSENALNTAPELVETLNEIRKYPNNTEALMDLQIGRLDAVVADEVVGRYYISKRPGVFRVLEEYLDYESYGVGIRDEDDSLRAEIDRLLDEMKADGTAREISKKWFGADVLSK